MDFDCRNVIMTPAVAVMMVDTGGREGGYWRGRSLA